MWSITHSVKETQQETRKEGCEYARVMQGVEYAWIYF